MLSKLYRERRTLKEEEVYLSDYEGFEDAYRSIGAFIEDVNMHKRPHASLGYLTPADKPHCSGVV